MKIKNISNLLKKNPLFVLTIALTIFIIPLIVYLKDVPLSGASYEYWTGAKSYFDFFTFYKARWLLILTVVITVFFVSHLIVNRRSRSIDNTYTPFTVDNTYVPLTGDNTYTPFTVDNTYIPLILYTVFIILSATLSDYLQISLFGFPDRCEGLFVLLCYVVLCFICSIAIGYENNVKIIITALLASMLLLSFIGISQFWNFDLFQTTFGKELILPFEHHSSVENLKFNFPQKFIYSTLYNPNYVGSYFSMLLPLCICLFVLCNKTIWKVSYGLLSILAFINLVGCFSSAGYIAGLLSIVILLIFLRKQLMNKWIWNVCLALCFICTLFVMNISSGNRVLTEISQVSSSIKPAGYLTDIDISEKKTKLYFSKDCLNISYDPASHALLFSDENDNNIDVTNAINSTDTSVKTTQNNIANSIATANGISFLSDNNTTTSTYNFRDPRFSSVSLTINKDVLLLKTINSTCLLYFTPATGFKFITPTNRVVDIENPPTLGFDGYERLGSSRGYIWSRSLPLLKNTIFIGTGPDTFAMYFPQNDISGKLKYLDNMYMIVDKPHNFYLQMALNTGLPSLISFGIFILLYLFKCFKLYFRPQMHNIDGCISTSGIYAYGVSCMLAVIAFLIAGIANDSVVSVSPVFWILLGVGMACNRLYERVEL